MPENADVRPGSDVVAPARCRVCARAVRLKRHKFCSQRCYHKFATGANHGFWKGGRYITAFGYVAIRMPGHHRALHNGYVLEHIVVAEKKIGRRLRNDECVHHIDENKQHNDPINIEVLKKSEHKSLHMQERWRNGYANTRSKQPTDRITGRFVARSSGRRRSR